MKPIAILQFSHADPPGYLLTFLANQNIPYQVIPIVLKKDVPLKMRAFSGLALLGGSMSVNDPLPWITPVRNLIRQANALDIPIIGHCLGAQLLALAFGGKVIDNIRPEIGWHRVDVIDNHAAKTWLPNTTAFTAFQWHYQTFSIPDHGIKILTNAACDNQAFVLNNHIGLQCHIEVTVDILQSWCTAQSAIAANIDISAVQGSEQILSQVEQKVANLRQVTNQIYTHWTSKLNVEQ